MKKRTVALVFLLLVLALVGATLAVLRTRWAGDRICRLAVERVERSAGLEVAFGACRIRPLLLELSAGEVRLGDPAAPVLVADELTARLAPVQALGGRVQLARLRLVRPRLAVRQGAVPGAVPGAGAAACPPPFLDKVEIRRLEISEGAIEASLPGGGRVSVGRLDLETSPEGGFRSLAAPGRRRTAIAATASAIVVEGAGERPVRSPRLALEAEAALDLSSAEIATLEAEVDGVRAALRGTVRDLCDPRLDLRGSAAGSLRDVLALARIARDADAEGTVEAEARIQGPAGAPAVSGDVRIAKGRVAWFTPGDVRAEVRLDGGALAVDRLDWSFRGGRVTGRGKVGLALPVPIEAELETEGIDLAEVLERLDIGGSWVSVGIDGKGKIGGTLVPPALAGTLAADFRELRVLTRSWREAPPSEPGVIEVRRGRLQTGLRVSERALAFDAARITAGRGTSEVDAEARFSPEEGFSVRWRGQIDLDAMGRIADIPWSGLARVDGTIAAAPYGNPRIVARGTRIEGFRFLDLDLGNAAADITYGPGFRMHVQDGQGVKGQSRFRGEGEIDLEPVPARVVWSRFEGVGRVRDLLDAVRDYVPATRPLRDLVDGDVEISGTASGKAGFLDGTFEGRLGTGTLFGRAFESGRAEGTFHDGLRARVTRAELKRGTGVVRMEGGWGFLPPFPWDIELSFAGVPLGALELPGGGWEGSASGTASLEGSLEHPKVRFAANGDGVAVHGVPLGTVQMGGTVNERRLLATGSSDVLRFEGEADLEGRLPYRARAELALVDVARLLPGTPGGLRARVRGEASAEGELASLEASRARARLDAIEIGHSEFVLESTAPVDVGISRGRLEVKDVILRGPETELRLSGSRSASGQIDLSASGDVDLRLLAGIGPGIRRPHGLLTVEAHVSGTVPEPVLVGAGRIDRGGFQLKGAPVTVSEVRGDLAFSQNRVLFEDLSAHVNGGRATLGGEVELSSFAPVRLRVEAGLEEVPIAPSPSFPVTLSGRVEVAGTPEASTVTGRIHVLRARYTADVEIEKGLLELRKRAAPPPRPYDRAGEWLRFDLQIAADGDCRVENDLVSGDVRGELLLTGTLASPGLVGSLAMSDGSTARFRGNEFALGHAVLDFTDRNRIDAAMDVHGQAKVRDYLVYMHAFGTMEKPKLDLTSSPPLSQPDIITLLSLGFTQRDAGVDTGLPSVAAAAAAQALFTASGLDEQVKRFLPRTGVLRDFSVRITSEWSEVTGAVEPRAEFESWLLEDRLRLRYQAPLSGARGQKAQAELRLGKHTALQYQWDNDNADVLTGDHGLDLKLRWEWTD